MIEKEVWIDTLHCIFGERCSSEGPYSVGGSGVERRQEVYDHLFSRREEPLGSTTASHPF